MSKIIPDIIHDKDINHEKYTRAQKNLIRQFGPNSNSNYLSEIVKELFPEFNPEFKIGDFVRGRNANNYLIDGILTIIEPEDEQGLFYHILGPENQSGWCYKIERSTTTKIYPEHFGSY